MASGRVLRVSFPAKYEIHEIAKRSHAPKRWAHPCNYLLLSSRMHNQIHSNNTPVVVQLAMKAICDPSHFDLEAWLALQPSLNPDRITLHDVNEAANELRWLHALFAERHGEE